MNLDFYTSAFCGPCMATRSVLGQVKALVPGAVIREHDVVRDEEAARTDDVRSTPTVIVRSGTGAEVFRAEGVPTVNQVLMALARAI